LKEEDEEMRSAGLCKLAIVAMVIALWLYSQSSCSRPQERESNLSALIPSDVAKANPTQEDMDELAWRVFVALNWPTREGQVDREKIIGQLPNAPRVWELYTDPSYIFKGSGASTQTSSNPQNRKSLSLSRKRIEKLSGKDDVQAAPAWPLVDQTGNFAIYEVRINDIQRGYITSNHLTTPTGIGNYKKPISFPDGSIEVKAAWRLLPENTPGDVLARYHLREAEISVPANESSTGQELQIKGIVGLVGLHITYKTRNQPKWIWSTFEHVDNYEVYYKPLPNLKPTFNGGAADPNKLNRQPMPKSTPSPSPGVQYLWSPTQPTAILYEPTEIARCPNEVALPSAINSRWQEMLAGVPGVENSPWQYYRLNTVQWFDARDRLQPKNTDGVAVSRNSVLETYLLGDQTIASQVPAILPVNSDPDFNPSNSTLGDTIVATILASKSPEKTGAYTWSSCVLCHQMALYQYGPDAKRDNVMTDYSFVFRSYLPAGGK
jgi:hypothetical protein